MTKLSAFSIVSISNQDPQSPGFHQEKNSSEKGMGFKITLDVPLSLKNYNDN